LLLSIVIVTKNNIAELLSTLQSISLQPLEILNQTEVLIVSANDIDYFGASLSGFPFDLRFICDDGSGLYEAMNIGLKQANGVWLLFLNSGDCFYHHRVLNHFYITLCSAHNLDVIFGLAIVQDQHGHKWSYPSNDINVLEWLRTGALPNHQAMFFHRNFYTSNTFNTSYKISSDSDYKIRALSSGRFIFVNSAVCLFSIGGLSSDWTYKSLKQQCLDRYARGLGLQDSLICITKLIAKLVSKSIFGTRANYLYNRYFKRNLK